MPSTPKPFTAMMSGMPIETSATTRFLSNGIKAQTINGAIKTMSGAK